jgi:hypothetical protein
MFRTIASIAVVNVGILMGISEASSSFYSMNVDFNGGGGGKIGTTRTRNRREAIQIESPDYYDRLRLEIKEAIDVDDESFVTVTNESNSSIYQVTLDPNEENSTTYRLAEVKSFIAFSKDSEVHIDGSRNDGYAVLLAMHHFNNMFELNYHPIFGDRFLNDPTLASCNVRLTTELLDSTLSPTVTTQTIASALGSTPSVSTPPTTAVVAFCPTTVTLPLAIFTGINSVPLISASTSSAGFDDKEQFPLFGRTVTAAAGEAAVSLKYFQSIQSTHVAILFVTVRSNFDVVNIGNLIAFITYVIVYYR